MAISTFSGQNSAPTPLVAKLATITSITSITSSTSRTSMQREREARSRRRLPDGGKAR